MKESIDNHLKSALIAGILTLVPLGVTFFILGFLFRKIGGWLPNTINAYFPEAKYPFLFGTVVQTVLGLILTILIVYLTGLLVTNIIGRKLVGVTEKFLSKIPIVREVYAPIKQIMQMILHPSESNKFKRAVAIKAPDSPFRIIGFVTGEVEEIDNPHPLTTVFVPTSPNPTTGVMLFCDPEILYDINLRAETAMQMLISGGLVAPSNILIGQTIQRTIAESGQLKQPYESELDVSGN